MRKSMICTIAMLLLFAAGAMADDDFDPTNPPDPQLKYKLTVSASPAEGGYVSGGGSYQKGTSVQVTTSARADYTFLYWMCGDEQISTERNFHYTMPDGPVSLVAVYEFTPSNPADPTAPNTYRLYLDNNVEGSCTFNITSGLKRKADQYVNVAAQNVSPGFKFQGWFADGVKVSDALSFNYLMPHHDVTLTAHFVYNPDNPADPFGNTGQTSVDTGRKGDVNWDGVVNISDAVLLVNHYLNGTVDELPISSADVNGDGEVNISDVVEIVNLYLNNQ